MNWYAAEMLASDCEHEVTRRAERVRVSHEAASTMERSTPPVAAWAPRRWMGSARQLMRRWVALDQFSPVGGTRERDC
jgi:hypothetical protein